MPTTALVIETNNLRGGSGSGSGGGGEREGEGDAVPAAVTAGLARLLAHLRAQTRPLATIDEIVVTHDGLPPEMQRTLEEAAGEPIRFVLLPPDTGYYEAKNLGFDATSAEVVAFADADCWPHADWLERLLLPLERGEEPVDAVAGRTTYPPDLFGIAATTIDFMYFEPRRAKGGSGSTRNFYANNVAFRRAVFAARRYPSEKAMYRGQCQMLGFRLQADRLRVRFVPEARTVHRFPDRLADLVRLRLHRGADTTRIAPHLTRAYLPPALRWVGRLGPLSSAAILAARLAASLRSIGRQDMPEVRGLRYLATVGLVAGISAVDLAGVFLRRPHPRSALAYTVGEPCPAAT